MDLKYLWVSVRAGEFQRPALLQVANDFVI
jgi:hypothetical protein